MTHREELIKTDSVEHYTSHKDTAYKERVVVKTKPVIQRIAIPKPCDSAGVLRDFSFHIGSGTNQATVTAINGRLEVAYKIDSTRQVMQAYYQTQWINDSIAMRKALLQEIEQNQETKKIVWPWWLWALLGVGALSVIGNIVQKLKLI